MFCWFLWLHLGRIVIITCLAELMNRFRYIALADHRLFFTFKWIRSNREDAKIIIHNKKTTKKSYKSQWLLINFIIYELVSLHFVFNTIAIFRRWLLVLFFVCSLHCWATNYLYYNITGCLLVNQPANITHIRFNCV